MIRKYTFGNPYPTEAVVVQLPAQTGPLPYFTISSHAGVTVSSLTMEQSMLANQKDHAFSEQQKEEKLSLFLPLQKADVVYGLGETIRGINKRGWVYNSYATDLNQHTESARSLYGAHNFLIVDGAKRFGIFIDHPGEVVFDVGYSNPQELRITPVTMDMDVYIIEGNSKLDIVRQFRSMIGRSYIAPRWALGYGQSRWGYASAADIRAVCDGYRKNRVGLDMIYLDIDYMRGFRNFTVDGEAYPDFSDFVAQMQANNIHLIPIIDAGVKAETGYFADDQGVANGYYIKQADGTDFVGTVWPGEVHFPDFLQPQARQWFGDQYKFLLDQGIDGFWNDMNEPAIFYSKASIDRLRRRLLAGLTDGSLDDWQLNAMGGTISNLSNNRDDYKSIFHHVDGKVICHDDVHNLYGYNMTRATGEAFARLSPEKRILMFSRSSYTGMHRYGGIWTGDNHSWWSHLKMNLTMLPGLSMQGFLYSGADLGGFGGDCTEDLLLRWLGLGIFTPLMRNHSAKGTREQEVYRFSDLPAFRRLISLRYFLLPYIYSEYMKACLKDDMLFKPLSFEYENDPHAAQVEDQLMMGESIMIAPVLQQNATGRYVYLPEEMKLLRLRSRDDYDEEVLPQGHHYISAELDEVLLFIRPDKLIPVSRGGECVPQVDFEDVDTIAFVKTEAVYDYYHDDGICRDATLDGHIRTIVIPSTTREETL